MDSFESFFENCTKEQSIAAKKQTVPVLLNERYLVGNKIGQGGLSDVYEVEDMYSRYFRHARKLAVKVPNIDFIKKQDIDAFLYAEYAHLLEMNRNGVIKVFDFGIDKQTKVPYLILEMLQGKLLSTVSLPSLSRSYKKKLFIFLYETLQYIHEKGIVHADVNPTNIICMKDQTFCLFDFGISFNIKKDQAFNISYSKNKAFNILYSAPEVILQEKPSFSSDIFSMAVIVYELYYEKLPYVNDSLELEKSPIEKKHLRKIPFLMRDFIYRALSYDKSMRKQHLSFIKNSFLINNIKKIQNKTYN
jgi:serine/threonine-protein kinase